MKKYLYLPLIALVALTLGNQNAYAEEAGTTAEVTTSTETSVSMPVKNYERPLPKKLPPAIREVRKEIQGDRKEMNDEIKVERKEMNQGIKDDRKMMASSTASTTPAQRKEERKESRKEFKEETKEKRADFREDAKGKREQMKQSVMIRIVLARLNATLSRIEKIVVKLDTRIEKFKTAGADVSIATTASSEAKTALSSAKVNIATIVVPKDGTTVSTTTIKTTVKAIEGDLRTAHKAIETALKSFKGFDVKVTDTATTTINN